MTKLTYLHVSEPDWGGGQPYSDAFEEAIRKAFPGVIVAAGAYMSEKAEELIGSGLIDAVAFRRKFIANPDLVARLGPASTRLTRRCNRIPQAHAAGEHHLNVVGRIHNHLGHGLHRALLLVV